MCATCATAGRLGGAGRGCAASMRIDDSCITASGFIGSRELRGGGGTLFGASAMCSTGAGGGGGSMLAIDTRGFSGAFAEATARGATAAPRRTAGRGAACFCAAFVRCSPAIGIRKF